MSATVNAEASVSPPLSNQCYAFAVVAGNPVQNLQLPDTFRNHWITIEWSGVAGAELYYSFSVTAQAVNPAAVSAVGPPVVPAVAGCFQMYVGQTEHYDLRNLKVQNTENVFFNIVGLVANGVVRFRKSDGPEPAV